MARTRKSIQPLNLYKYDVLIEDKSTRSDYFKVSQFDGYFYGGRNAFLVAGSTVLHPSSKILVEILNKDGTTVYSAPVPSFIEGSSRLVKIEVYEDTPIGPGKIVLLGQTDSYLDGTPIPPEWRDKYNVRWSTDVIISPRVKNKTPIRFVDIPACTIEEKFYYTPAQTIFTASKTIPVDIDFSPKYFNVYQNGYLVKLIGPANSYYSGSVLGGIITGSAKFTSSVGIIETASISIPITRIFNNQLAESTGSLIYTNNTNLFVGGTISSSGKYNTYLDSFGVVNVSSSLSLKYDELVIQNTGSAVSYAKLRYVNLGTYSGEIHKLRISYKPTTEPGEYILLGDVPIAVGELLLVDTGSSTKNTGNFSDLNISDYWYASTMSVARTDTTLTIPDYYKSSSLVLVPLPIRQDSTFLLNSINATPTIVSNAFLDNKSYFIGTKGSNNFQLFPNSEYTLAFDALVTSTSASVSLNQSDYSLEVYLVEHSGSNGRILTKDPRGQLIGTITPTSGFLSENLDRVELNFTPQIVSSGYFALRFIVYGGYWNIANASLKAAEEPFFSPDEITVLIPNVNYATKYLTFKTEYLDINNNSAKDITLASPIYFTGSGISTPTTASYAVTSSRATSSSYAISSSYAVSASYSISSSYAISASYSISSSYAVSSSRTITSSFSTTSSYAITASYAPTVTPGVDQYDTGTNVTWTKPSNITWVLIELWGGGGSGGCGGGNGEIGGGGGGGAYNFAQVKFSDLVGTVTYTVGAGGTGVTGSAGPAPVAGNKGGDTSVTLNTFANGSTKIIYAYGGGGGGPAPSVGTTNAAGGGGGGGALSAGSTGGANGSGGAGGSPGGGVGGRTGSFTVFNLGTLAGDSSGFGGGGGGLGTGSATSICAAGASYYGGGGGGGAFRGTGDATNAGGSSVYGGGGGGGAASAAATPIASGGLSIFGGSGSAGGANDTGSAAGSAPAGGSGGVEYGRSGNGANGRVRFTYW